MKKVLREMQTLHALAVVRFGHCHPPVANTQTHKDQLQYTAPLASAQFNNEAIQ